jgi:hypothetical protein
MKTLIPAFGTTVCIVALSLSGVTSRAQNLLVDPSFESQTPPGSGGWNLFNGAAFSMAFAHTGASSMLDSGGGGFGVPGSYETFATSAGLQYDLTGYGYAPTPPGGGVSFGILQITFFSGPNGTGSNLGTINVSNGGIPTGPGNAQTSLQINSGSPVGQWLFLDTGIAQAPAGSQSVAAYTLVVDQNPATVYFDDLSLIQVPEPSTLALLGIALSSVPAFVWSRRR